MSTILTQKYLKINDFYCGKVFFPAKKQLKIIYIQINFKIKDFFFFDLKII